MPGGLLILATDGIGKVIDMLNYEETLRADVRRLAERILQDWRRGTDDGAMLVFRSGAA